MNRMAQWLKRYFIPHKENDHRPHILRRKAIALVCLVALGGELAFLLGTSFVAPRNTLFGIIVINALTDETNGQRTLNDLSTLKINPLLQAAAQEKANDMVANNYFAHTSPSGKTPWYWLANVGYNFKYAGENLAINYADSQDVTTAWMNSPEHRANILDSHYTEIGMATARGELNGNPAIYVVELFGMPAATSAANKERSNASGKAAAIAVTPIVAALETATSANIGQTLIAVKGASTGTAAVNVAPAPQPAIESNLVQNALANPRQTTNYFYLGLIGLFIIALLSNIFIKIRIQHPNLIFGGVAVIAVAAVCIILNQQLAGLGTFIL